MESLTYPGRVSRLSADQRTLLSDWIAVEVPQTAQVVCDWVEGGFGVNYAAHAMARLLGQIDFVFKKPKCVPAKADAAIQQAFLDTALASPTQAAGPETPLYFVDDGLFLGALAPAVATTVVGLAYATCLTWLLPAGLPVFAIGFTLAGIVLPAALVVATRRDGPDLVEGAATLRAATLDAVEGNADLVAFGARPLAEAAFARDAASFRSIGRRRCVKCSATIWMRSWRQSGCESGVAAG